MDISNPLLLSMIRLIRKDRSKEPPFFEALHQAKLLCPVQVDTRNLPRSPDGSIVLSNDGPISLSFIPSMITKRC